MNTTFAALAEPNRLRIVELLQSGPLTAGEIGDRLGLRQPQASKHLRVLREAGLVGVTADAQRRHYELRAEPFTELTTWVESCRRYWNDRLDALERHLDSGASASRTHPPARPRRRSRTT